MYVCSCLAVTDRAVNAAIATGAATVEEITERCRAGGRCGGCGPTLQRLLERHRRLEHEGSAHHDHEHVPWPSCTDALVRALPPRS